MFSGAHATHIVKGGVEVDADTVHQRRMPTCPMIDEIHIGLGKFRLVCLHKGAHRALYVYARERGQEPCTRGKKFAKFSDMGRARWNGKRLVGGGDISQLCAVAITQG